MKGRNLILIFATVFPIICCAPEYVKPIPPKPRGDDTEKEEKTGDVTFTFSAATSKYASLKESVTLGVGNPGKATVDVDWGDGSKDSGKDAKFIHKYVSPGKYTVKAKLDGSNEEWEIEINVSEQNKIQAANNASAAASEAEEQHFAGCFTRDGSDF